MIFLQLTEAERGYAADLADPNVRRAKQAIDVTARLQVACRGWESAAL